MGEETEGQTGTAIVASEGVPTVSVPAGTEELAPGISRFGRRRLTKIAKSLRRLPQDPRYREAKASLSLDLNARKLKGGREAFIGYARAAAKDNAIIEQFVLVWDYLPARDRKIVALDSVCDASGVGRKVVLGAVAAEACSQGNDLANMIMGNGIPEVARAAVRNASRVKGFKDREMLLTARGLMPINKGETFVNNVMQSQVMRMPDGAPSFEDDILEVSAENEILPESTP